MAGLRRGLPIGLALSLSGLAGCALSVPGMQRLGETAADEASRENNLAIHIRCELRQAVAGALAEESMPGNRIAEGYSASWLRGWGAKVSLVLTVDEKAAVAPGLTVNNPMKNIISTFSSGGNVPSQQNATQTVGGSLSSDATRAETVSFFYPFTDLIAEHDRIVAARNAPESPCSGGGALVDGDLRIADFMRAKVLMSRVPGTLIRKSGQSPFDTLTYHITFIEAATGTFTPAWKLERLTISPTPPLLNGSRTRTDDLTITMGSVTDKNGVVSATQALEDANLAALIGQAVAKSLESQQH